MSDSDRKLIILVAFIVIGVTLFYFVGNGCYSVLWWFATGGEEWLRK